MHHGGQSTQLNEILRSRLTGVAISMVVASCLSNRTCDELANGLEKQL